MKVLYKWSSFCYSWIKNISLNLIVQFSPLTMHLRTTGNTWAMHLNTMGNTWVSPPSWSCQLSIHYYIFIMLVCIYVLSVTTVEPVRSDTWVFRHPVTSDKKFRSQIISFAFFVKKPWVFRHLSLPTSDTVLRSQCY